MSGDGGRCRRRSPASPTWPSRRRWRSRRRARRRVAAPAATPRAWRPWSRRRRQPRPHDPSPGAPTWGGRRAHRPGCGRGHRPTVPPGPTPVSCAAARERASPASRPLAAGRRHAARPAPSGRGPGRGLAAEEGTGTTTTSAPGPTVASTARPSASPSGRARPSRPASLCAPIAAPAGPSYGATDATGGRPSRARVRPGERAGPASTACRRHRAAARTRRSRHRRRARRGRAAAATHAANWTPAPRSTVRDAADHGNPSGRLPTVVPSRRHVRPTERA